MLYVFALDTGISCLSVKMLFWAVAVVIFGATVRLPVLNGLPEKTFFGIFLNAKDILETQVGAVDRTEISGIQGAVVELLGSSAIHRSYAREIGENFARFDQNQAHSSRTDCSR